MSKEIFNQMRVAEAYGEIPVGTANAATFATIAEVGLNAAYEGYFGKKWVNEAYDTAKVEQHALEVGASVIADVRDLHRTMEATHSTSDFPLALQNLRARAVREAYVGEDSRWRDFASVTTTPDFKAIRSLRFDEAPELLLRPEGTNVQYLTLGESEDGYRVSNFERAIKYTWEMYVNDEVGKFAAALRSFGEGARRTEVITVFNAINTGLVRTVLPVNGAGVPTVARLIEMEETLTTRTFVDSENNSVEHGYMLTDLIHGTRERQHVYQVLNQEHVTANPDAPNPMMGAFESHLERLWSRVMGRDYVGYDRNVNWLEVAFLQGFQGGPKTYVKMPTSQDYPDEGSFEDHTLHIKMGHTLGAKVIEPKAAIRVQGAA